MKRSLFFIFLFTFVVFITNAEAQKPRILTKTFKKPATAIAQQTRETSNTAIVIDERLGVLRFEPSLFSKSFLRMQNGRRISILSSKESDGVTFYRVSAPPNNFGWVQAEAVA